MNLFGENDYKNYAYTGAFKIKLEIEFNGHIFKNEYRSAIEDTNKFLVEVVEELDDTSNLKSWGLLHTSFKGDICNILTNILSILYKQVCKRFNFEYDYSLKNKAFF